MIPAILNNDSLGKDVAVTLYKIRASRLNIGRHKEFFRKKTNGRCCECKGELS